MGGLEVKGIRAGTAIVRQVAEWYDEGIGAASASFGSTDNWPSRDGSNRRKNQMIGLS